MRRLIARIKDLPVPRVPNMKLLIDNVTIDELYALWHKQLEYGEDGGGLSGAVCREEREHYDSLFEFGTLKELKDIVDLDDLFAYLKKCHPAFADRIAAAVPALTTLLYAHANFPFVTDTPFSDDRPLTKDALLHSLALLTSRCIFMFKQSATLGDKPGVLSCCARAKVKFTFSALANPPSGVSTVHDVLDVVCRLAYPEPRREFSLVRERPAEEFVPLAERLSPKDLPKSEETMIEVVKTRPLVELCLAVRGFERAATDKPFGSIETLHCDQFLE